ncbi:type I-E CRISPR-associated protein Cas6/Cse3/CasE [Hornefia butyriciproducens]|uniref:Type I-E CRISPR-associated protein Cas6/Cse3/CasE n=1 Tax=Hornefia butyriciproducens TaxID=2652293 RepID=A0A6L5Y2S6_9FIRM|nr:type I-E CRISPR-associated protein Cas6/Cse3/CasE [Hornefia butyriciproducens]MST51080.1 type I-E CRISPR-associated protein Cas6/Cse3/CasE [Hornefia butyriciproducens]
MYLSRVEIDILDRRKIKELTHLGAYHNWVEMSFPDEVDQEIRTRKLWRIDRIRDHLYLLIVSENKPNLEALERYGVSGSAKTKDYDKFLDSISEGELYRFRVTLNPVRAVSQGEGKRGRVMPEITAEQQLAFLESRAERLGFKLMPEEYQIVERSWEPFRKKGQRMMRLSKATYEGILKVTDEELFYNTLTKGIGKKKAYGFGLMTVIPL